MKYVSNDIAGALEIISDSSETMIETAATNIDIAYGRASAGRIKLPEEKRALAFLKLATYSE